MNPEICPYFGEADLHQMAALANAFPTHNLHVTDLPYRFTSWALDYPGNIAFWADAGGTLLGWTILQTPFWTIDAAFALYTGVGFQVVEDVLVFRKEYGGR